MIDIEENGYIYIVGWSEYQNTEELSKLKERERCKEAMRDSVRSNPKPVTMM